MDGISVQELLERRSHLFTKHPVIAGQSGLNRLITNVNVMEVPDIYGQVRKGDLLLTTGYSIKDNILAQENLIFGLAERNISAIGIKMKRYINSLPRKMLDQAEKFQIPIIDLSAAINFSLVISEVLEEILRQKTREIEQAHHDSQQLTNLLVTGESLKIFVENVSLHLNRTVMLITENGDRIGTSDELGWPHYGDLALVPLARQPLADVQLFAQANATNRFVWYPIGNPSEHIGYLVYEDKEPALSTSQLMLLQHASKLLVLKLTSLQGVTYVEERYRDIFLRKWILGELLDKEAILKQAATSGLLLQDKYVLIVASYTQNVPNQAHIVRDISLLGQGMFVVPFDQQVIILIPDRVFTNPSFSISDLLQRLGTSNRHVVRLGISSEKSIEHISQAYREAKESIAIYAVVEPKRVLCHYEELGIYTMLYRIKNNEDLLHPALNVLRPLFREGVKNRNELVETLSCYVYQNANIKKTADALYCHYNSVLYRLERIESLLGIPIRTPEAFFHVQLAIRLYDFVKKFEPQFVDEHLHSQFP